MPTATSSPKTDPRQGDLFGLTSINLLDQTTEGNLTQVSIQPYYEPPTIPVSSKELARLPTPKHATPKKKPKPAVQYTDSTKPPARSGVYWPDPRTVGISWEREDEVPKDFLQLEDDSKVPDSAFNTALTDEDQVDLLGSDGEFDTDVPDIDQIFVNDSWDVILAKLMFNRFKYDLGFGQELDDRQDELFGVTTTWKRGVRTIDKLNAIVWLYSFHPQEVQVSFEWVCDVLSLDIELIRRIVARHARNEIRQTIELIAPLSKELAQECEDKVSHYVFVQGWLIY